ncbi:hypothetical protein GQ600_12495 [Phytophthora cactorum]|nr:hypothetical protein GQ600_12495 [Phytophthora cactorum]
MSHTCWMPAPQRSAARPGGCASPYIAPTQVRCDWYGAVAPSPLASSARGRIVVSPLLMMVGCHVSGRL